MDISKSLLNFGKKIITAEELATLLKVSIYNEKDAYEKIESLVEKGLIEPVKASGKNGNLTFPLYKKYRILLEDDEDETSKKKIKALHPLLKKSGYLSSHSEAYSQNEMVIECLNRYFFSKGEKEYISRKERSFAIFGREKILDDSSVKHLLKNLQIGQEELKYYDTPEYCFHDYIPVRKDRMVLLICENKDIWFNIRRCMFEDGYKSLFGKSIDGVVYGNGNKVSQKQGALEEYVKFMGSPDVEFLYWGDIDREGFDIFRRTKEVNSNIKISLFLPGYKMMIERAKGMVAEESSSSKKEGVSFDELFTEFNADEKLFLRETLEANKLIPQEIVPYTFLREE